MRATKGVHFDSETYAVILGSLARYGYFNHNAESIPDLKSLGLSEHTSGCGPKLLDEIMNQMAEDVTEISEEAAEILFDGFQVGFGLSTTRNETNTNSTESDFQGIPLCSKDGKVLQEQGVSVGRVTIESATALCPSTGARLRQLTLDHQQRKHVHDTLLQMSATQQKDYGARYQNRTKYKFSQVAEEELKKFADWLV